MNVTIERTLGYRDIYGKQRLFWDNILAFRIGRKKILQFAALMLTYCRKDCRKPLDEIIQMFFIHNGEFDHVGYELVMQKVDELRATNPGLDFGILSEEALLNLYIWAVNNAKIPDDGNGQEDSNSPYFLQLLLMFNEKVLEKYNKAVNSIKKYKDRSKLRLVLTQRFPQSDIIDIDYGKLIFTQSYKLMKLLTFLKNNPGFKPVYDKLLNDFKVASTEEFFKALGGAVFSPLNLKKSGINSLIIEDNADAKANAEFLDNLAHSSAEVEEGPTDYRFLRDKPLQKLPDEYRIIFDFFLIKKMYNGIIFKLSSYVKANPDLFKGQLFGAIRDQFTEAVLLYDTMSAVFSNAKAISVTGNEFKAAGLQREPDYYNRHTNRIMIIESKDFFMTAEEKLSYDFDTIMGGLSKDGRLKKATLQLATNTGRVLQQALPIDKAYDPTKTSIYPVVVLHDTLYETPSLNYWVNEWYQDELSKMKEKAEFKGVDFSVVKPVTLVDIDTLILYRINFEKGELDLYDMIEAYQKYVDFKSANDQNFENAVIPFSAFARNYVEDKGVDVDLKLIHDTYHISGYKD